MAPWSILLTILLGGGGGCTIWLYLRFFVLLRIPILMKNLSVKKTTYFDILEIRIIAIFARGNGSCSHGSMLTKTIWRSTEE